MTKIVKNVFGFRYLSICASCVHCVHEALDFKGVLRPCLLHKNEVHATDVCDDWVSDSRFASMKYSEKPGTIKNGEYLHYLANFREREAAKKYSTYTPVESIREQWEEDSGKSIYITL